MTCSDVVQGSSLLQSQVPPCRSSGCPNLGSTHGNKCLLDAVCWLVIAHIT